MIDRDEIVGAGAAMMGRHAVADTEFTTASAGEPAWAHRVSAPHADELGLVRPAKAAPATAGERHCTA